MLLTCNKCQHQWEEPVGPAQQAARCPRCGAAVAIDLSDQHTLPSATPVRQPDPVHDAPTLRPEPSPLRDTVLPATPIASGASSPASVPELPQLTPQGDLSVTNIASPQRATLQIEPLANTYDSMRPQPSPVQGGTVPPSAGETAGGVGRTSSGEERTVIPPKPPVPPAATRHAQETRRGPDPNDVSGLNETAPPKPMPSKGPVSSLAPEANALVGKNVGGYVIEKLLGQGGMGAVFLARQMSLDREVALKILPAQFATNGELLMRFTREALSAAQIAHHNVIQVHDVGAQQNTHFISMEFVKGENLGQMVRRDGRMQIDDAVGYILQAARGLKYAHERGIIHRDIKPDNLMVDQHGVVKVADLGLAKIKGDPKGEDRKPMADNDLLMQARGDLTMAEVAMGTPAYMSPEQARDAASVDARADQYSLGCTLYYLCAGKAPYSGTTAFELMSKHMTEPLTPLDVHVKGVPPALSTILNRMLEKDPTRRYPTLGEAIRDLEAFLGVDSDKGPFTPREQHLKALETELAAYNAAPSIKKRQVAQVLMWVALPLLMIVLVYAKQFGAAANVLGLIVLTPFFNFCLDGILNKTYLFRRVRSVFFGMPVKSWLMFIAGALMVSGALVLTGFIWYLVLPTVLAAGFAVGYQFLVIRALKKERSLPLQVMRDLLKMMRLRGLSEEALMNFVCRFSGRVWEEFFEDLFGYEEMVIARGKWAAADKVTPRRKFATWRDPIMRSLESVEEARKIAREKKALAAAEAMRLKDKGVSAADAEKQAAEEATKIMSEGLIKQPVVQAGEARVVNFRSFRIPWKLAFGLVRFVLAATVIAAAIQGMHLFHAKGMSNTGVTALRLSLPMPGLPLPDFIVQFLGRHYFSWGHGADGLGLAAGLLLLSTCFSRRVFLPLLVMAGTVLLVGYMLFAGTAGVASPTPGQSLLAMRMLFTGLGLTAGGWCLMLLGKLTGGNF